MLVVTPVIIQTGITIEDGCRAGTSGYVPCGSIGQFGKQLLTRAFVRDGRLPVVVGYITVQLLSFAPAANEQSVELHPFGTSQGIVLHVFGTENRRQWQSFDLREVTPFVRADPEGIALGLQHHLDVGRHRRTAIEYHRPAVGLLASHPSADVIGHHVRSVAHDRDVIQCLKLREQPSVTGRGEGDAREWGTDHLCFAVSCETFFSPLFIPCRGLGHDQILLQYPFGTPGVEYAAKGDLLVEILDLQEGGILQLVSDRRWVLLVAAADEC